MPSPGRRILARFVRLTSGVKISSHLFVYLLLVTVGLSFFFIQFCGQRKNETADHIRRVKLALTVAQGQNGGYPATLADLEKSGMPVAEFDLKDAWGRPLRYTPRAVLGRSDTGGAMFRECDLRSAGPNGKFDDDDDIFWVGKGDSPPPGGDTPPGMPPPER